MANVINSLKLGDGTYVFTTPYATCDTAAATAAKVATITPGSNFSLETGARVAVKFTHANAASAPTLNVNSTGAKSIYFKNATITSSLNFWSDGQIVEFIYDGTNWNYSAAVSNTDTKDTTGSSNTSSKIFLVGAASQASFSTTYSHDTVYIGTDGCLNVRSADSDNERMIVAGTSIKKVTPVGTYEYGFPSLASGNSATIALTSDIPDVSNFVTPNVLNASLGNYVDISSAQEISGKKTFTGGVQFGTGTVFNNGGIQIPAANAFKVMGMYDVSLPSKTGTLATTGDIPSTSSFATLSGNNTFTGITAFSNTVSCGTIISNSGFMATNSSNSSDFASFEYNSITRSTNSTSYTLTLPTKSGTIALTSDIPSGGGSGDVTAAGNNIFTGTNQFKGGTSFRGSSNYFITAEFMTATSRPGDPVTTIDANGVICKNSSDPGTYYKDTEIKHKNFTLTLPTKNGTLATTNDFPIKTATLSGTTLSITLS